MNDIFRRRYSDEKLRQIFEHVDLDQTGEIDWSEFQAFLKEMDEMAEARRLAEKAEREKEKEIEAEEATAKKADEKGSSGTNPARDGQKGKDTVARRKVIHPEHWRIMYCGGSAPVVKSLRTISKTHKVPLELESFAW